MERVTWKGYVKEGMLDEYKRRHDEIWPEMSQMLTDAGIHNYTIWNVGNELFGYYECDKGAEFALDYQANSPVVAKWNVYMDDILTFAVDPITGEKAKPRLMFYHE
jgi:L-rhamnose mutarotase